MARDRGQRGDDKGDIKRSVHHVRRVLDRGFHRRQGLARLQDGAIAPDVVGMDHHVPGFRPEAPRYPYESLEAPAPCEKITTGYPPGLSACG